MKRVIFARHAKSDWDDPSVDDHDRVLSRRGERDAPVMGRRLAARGLKLDRVMSSSATRALTTAQLIAAELGVAATEIVVEPRLYLASVSTMLEVLSGLPDEWNSVILFAHNPGLTDAAVKVGKYATSNLPTCGMFGVDFETDRWAEIGTVPTAQVLYDAPKLGD